MQEYPKALYHKDYPAGKVFNDADQCQEAVDSGWVEAPWLVKKESDIDETDEKVEKLLKKRGNPNWRRKEQ